MFALLAPIWYAPDETFEMILETHFRCACEEVTKLPERT